MMAALIFVAFLCVASSFTPPRHTQLSISSTQLHVFDFFRQRTKEGIDQLSNIADAAKKGELGKGLAEAAAYTAASNQAFASGLAKSRDQLLRNLNLLGGIDPEEQMEELMDILLQADLGITTAEDIVQEVESLRDSASSKLTTDDLKSILRGKLLEALETEKTAAIQFSELDKVPTVLFIMGANGMGKTTTIGKLANRLRIEGNQTVLMAACDTFRAGAVDQLQTWADRAEVDLVGPDEQAKSPSAVLYKALDKALTEQYDTVLVDTSGRLSNNDALTAELVKMKRVIRKRLASDGELENEDVPHDTLLVIDAAQGRMALDSAKAWDKELGLTGLILTKLDGSARGGSVVAVSRDLKLPVKLVGVGEGIDDLRDFEADNFVDGLLGIGAAGGSGTADEGAMLQDRLKALRAERDERSKVLKTVQPAAVAERELEMAQATTGNAGNGARRPKRPKNKKKKRTKK